MQKEQFSLFMTYFDTVKPRSKEPQSKEKPRSKENFEKT